jgi:sucrose-6-phosphate hydrolase SacC (GH32 family)
MRFLITITVILFGFSAIAQQYRSVPAEKDHIAYLFAYFTGNRVAQEAIHFAVSMDGYNYYAMNDNQPVLDSKDISSTGGVRDPHILRREDGTGFYMVVTDMTSSKGWDSTRALVLTQLAEITLQETK